MQSHPQRTEEQQGRLDRQLAELLAELRIAMPGVQLLFGFLLAVPFNQRFAQVSEFQRDVYLVALLASAVSSALFIAPTAYHRIMFGRGDKPRMIRDFTRASLAGLVMLSVAMACAVLLVTSFLFGDTLAGVLTAALLAFFCGLWFVLPWRRRKRLPLVSGTRPGRL